MRRRRRDPALHFCVAADSLATCIEPLSFGDAVAVAQCIALDADAFPYPSSTLGLRESGARRWVARDVRNPTGRCPVVAFLAGHVRGWILYIEGLTVEKTARRRGVGRALVREAVHRARGEKIDAITLHVSVTNREAIGLYRSEGFAVRARLQGFYRPAVYGDETDAYEMELRLSTRGSTDA